MDKQKVKDNDNNITYCSKCLKQIDINDKDVVRGIDKNVFCDIFCRRDYFIEIRQDFDDIYREVYRKD